MGKSRKHAEVIKDKEEMSSLILLGLPPNNSPSHLQDVMVASQPEEWLSGGGQFHPRRKDTAWA